MAVKLTIVFAYMAGLLLLGLVASRRVKDTKDYFAAGKQLGFWATAFSARATGESAWLLLGLTGLGALVGVHAMWVVVGETLGVAAAWLLMARKFKRLTDRYESITVPDYLESRFRDGQQLIRRVSAVTLMVFVTIYVSAQIDATGKAFESFLSWNYFAGALVGFGVVIVYITTGGFLAVAWSDVVQGTLMLVGLVTLPIVGVLAVGGLGGVGDTIEALRAIDPDLLTMSRGGWTLDSTMGAIGGAMIGAGFLGSPQVFVRYIAMRSTGEIKPGARVAIVWTILADGGAVLSGMVGRVLLTRSGDDAVAILGIGGESVLPMMVEHLFPLVIVGMYVAVVLSAIMSTVDSLLVLAASAVVRDWYQQVRHPNMAEAELMPLARKVTIGLAVVALIIAMSVAVISPDRTVYWFVVFGWSGIAATFCPTMIMSLFWPGLTVRGVIASMATGFVCVPLLKFVVFKLDETAFLASMSELPPAFALSFVVGWLVSRAAPSPELRQAAADDLAWAASDAE